MMTEQISRQIAYKIQIKDIINSDYIKEEGWTPNYILDRYGRKVSRVNMIAAIIDIPNIPEGLNYSNVILDDGTGSIHARMFENQELLESFSLGTIVLIIGRIREYNDERYIIPEIIRQVENKLWIDVRKKELSQMEEEAPTAIEDTPMQQKSKMPARPETPPSPQDKEAHDPSDKVLNAIRKLDKGDGVDIDELIKESGIDDAEDMVNSLLIEGDVFEIKPGRLKVLD